MYGIGLGWDRLVGVALIGGALLFDSASGKAASLVLGVSVGDRRDQPTMASDIAQAGQLGLFEVYMEPVESEVTGVQFDIVRAADLPRGVNVGRFLSEFGSHVLVETELIKQVNNPAMNLYRERVVAAGRGQEIGESSALLKLGELLFSVDIDSPSASIELFLQDVVWSDRQGVSQPGEGGMLALTVEAPVLVIPPLPVPTVPEIPPMFTGIQVNSEGVTVEFRTPLGQEVHLEASNDFSEWTIVSEADGSVETWTYTDGESLDVGRRFYRLVVVVE